MIDHQEGNNCLMCSQGGTIIGQNSVRAKTMKCVVYCTLTNNFYFLTYGLRVHLIPYHPLLKMNSFLQFFKV